MQQQQDDGSVRCGCWLIVVWGIQRLALLECLASPQLVKPTSVVGTAYGALYADGDDNISC